ncbi:hypothetical protein [Micromonospora humi]|uniref:Uncharacterized protein n=1 Tax=Micromonospora humi TaxID=745366 RepID=A0A1C5JTN7_9ACTN|nr:hypothetical protein [Micromonospora humi]SCG73609.1 hypothetical protein GA0070213_113139 [Micromonospora humi]
MTIDEKRVADLLRLLEDEPDRPSRIDLGRAIREARRRRRNRRVGTAGAAALGVLAFAALPVALHQRPDAGAPEPAVVSGAPTPAPTSPSPRPPVCTAEFLSAPTGRSLVTGGDPSGRWLVGRLYPGGLSYPVVLWHDGKPQKIKLPGSDQRMLDVNRHGLAVGETFVADRSQAWAVRAGRASRLSGSGVAGATAVNDAGRIVGFRQVGERQLPVVWENLRSEAVDLPLPGPRWEGTAVAVGEDGTVVGKVSDGPSGDMRAAVWRTGASRPELLPLPSVPDGTAFQFAPGSMAGDWVIGTAYRELDPGRVRSGWQLYPTRINVRTGESVALAEPFHAEVGNDRGWLAGESGRQVAVLHTGAGLLMLPRPGGGGAAVGAVASMSDDGQVLGGQVDLDGGGFRAVRWTCR